MKTLPTGLAAHVLLGSTTLAYVLKVVRKDAVVFAFTSADQNVTLSGVLYLAAPGLNISSIALTAGLSVDNLELTTLDDGSTFTRADVLGGRWNNADFTIGRYNQATPANELDVIMAGTIGQVQLQRGYIVAELRGLQQYLQQPVGNVTSKNCRARLGDAMCTVNLASYTVTGSVTTASSNGVFTDSSKAQAADYFNEGVLTWTSGPNNGLAQKVKTFASGVFTLSLPMISTIGVGNTFSVYAGCQKRLAQDCVAKFNNVLNFQGEPHLPGIDTVTQPMAFS